MLDFSSRLFVSHNLELKSNTFFPCIINNYFCIGNNNGVTELAHPEVIHHVEFIFFNGYSYVLPNHMLLQISETLPREMQGILACCNPIPPLVRSNLLEIHQIILRAKEQPLEKPIMKEDTRARGTTLKISKINVDSPLNCPHDLTKSNEFRDDLPTLMGSDKLVNIMDLLNKELDIEVTSSKSTVFDVSEKLSGKEKTDTLKKICGIGYLGPFERYKLVKPFIQAEEERLANEKNKTTEEIKESLLSTTEDNRTDEERIESIREHFLNLARKTVPVVEEVQFNQTLVQMGGTKKRKRELSPEIHPSCSLSKTTQTPVPYIDEELNKIQKRKSSDPPDDSPNKIQKPGQNQQSSKRSNRRNRRKDRQKYNQNALGQQGFIGQQIYMAPQNVNVNFNANMSGYENQPRHDEGNNLFEIDTAGGDRKFANGNQSKKTFRRRGKKNNKMQQDNKQVIPERQNQDFAPYDYASVDFRQFQAGAQVVQQQRQFKSSYRAKGRKKNTNKSNNTRMATFGNGKKGR